ncbi:hypothetical protein GGX14DRAFT_555937 [Mycena pura]|uniref:TauD/TfdA-like domain-containing protein n=1 Tax=Mycena pura TaxID=153505 RepID=A0AAD7E458_9AGAR|nr:hypothetical protein GGX14DRAFT_555937 [Mycena pura]
MIVKNIGRGGNVGNVTDFRFVWAGAKLTFPFVRRGVVPEGTSLYDILPLAPPADSVPATTSYLLPRLLGHSRADSLLLTGDTFPADSPLIQGLYHKILPTREEVFPAALAFAQELAATTSQVSVAVTKGLIQHPGDSVEENHIYDSRGMRELAQSADGEEGIRSFKEKRAPKFTVPKVVTGPEVGGDTLWSSGQAAHANLQDILIFYYPPDTRSILPLSRRLTAFVALACMFGANQLRPSIRWCARTLRPDGRAYTLILASFTRRIVGVPKAESDVILSLIFHQISENPDFQVRFKWEKSSVAFWDTRVVTHSATFDFRPATRHALRATPHGERPTSVADYEKQTGKVAKDRQLEARGPCILCRLYGATRSIDITIDLTIFMGTLGVAQ